MNAKSERAPSPTASILVVDDEADVLRYMKTILEVDAYRVSTARSGLEALQLVKQNPPDLVLLDLLMPDLDGLQTLEQLRQAHPSLKVVMLSCSTEPRRVVQAIRLGAQDYIAKPFQKSELDAVLKHYLNLPVAVEEPEIAQGPEIIEDLGNNLQFAAASPAMRKIYAQIRQVAAVEVPVLILGESGTGKEVVSRLIHRMSERHRRTFMKVNCAALPGDLLESELFGYEPGAFTGAVGSKPGKFELCDKGTILLDEIGEMPPGLQAKLLHVLQDHQYSRLGARTTVRVDVRILAATNIDIRKALETKKLREDLYYRLNTFVIQLPPLRERKEEIPLLLRQFMTNFAERFGREPLPLSSPLIEAALEYSWPGNLRELENFVKRYLILGEEQLVIQELHEEGRRSAVPPERDGSHPARPSGDLKGIVRKLKDVAELNAITSALAQTNWNRKKAAQLLNISYKALLYKIRQYGIQPMIFFLFGLSSLLTGH